MSEKKEVTVDLDNETCIEEKTKRVRKVPCSEKVLENLAKGRGKIENNYEKRKKRKKKQKTYVKKKNN